MFGFLKGVFPTFSARNWAPAQHAERPEDKAHLDALDAMSDRDFWRAVTGRCPLCWPVADMAKRRPPESN